MPSKSSHFSLSHESGGFHCKHESKLKNNSCVSPKCIVTSSPLPSSQPVPWKELASFLKVSSGAAIPGVSKDSSDNLGTITEEVGASLLDQISESSQYQVVADTGALKDFFKNLPAINSSQTSVAWNKKIQDSINQLPSTQKSSISGSQFSHLFLLSNLICAHSKQYRTFDDGKDVLLIGGDLLISKTGELSSESIRNSFDIRADKSKSILSSSTPTDDSLTIQKIKYKCKVLQEHSRECGCWTPRLHVYLSNSHRCSEVCSVNNFKGTANSLAHISSNCTKIYTTANMTGKSRGKTRSRKATRPQKLSNKKVSKAGKTPKMNASVQDEHIRNKKLNSVVSSHQNDEPESELLGEGECESLPTIMSTLSGDVEYIVLDDDTLNLSASVGETVSPDTLKSKINHIYEVIDEKPDICNTEVKSSHVKEVKKRLNTSDRRVLGTCSQSTGSQAFSPVVDEKSNDEKSRNKSDDKASSSLAGVCTNRCPSIKDIFGDVSIKEEPVEDIKNDMTVEDFSKEISKLSDANSNLSNSNGVQKQEPVNDGYDETTSNGLFARLIKEETIVADEIDINTHSSDDSLGPLQIDEDRYLPSLEDTSMSVMKDVNEFNLPCVNIISPFKIKIFFGGPNRESIQFPADQSESSTSNTSSLYKTSSETKRNGVTTSKKYKRSPKKAGNLGSENDINVIAATAAAQTIQSLTCIYCNTACPNGDALAKHFENHQKEGLIICYFCQKSFGDKTGMKRHMRTHTGEKPYQCKVCGKRFSLPGNFKKHRDIHEDRRTEPCSICGKTFRRKEHLKYHMRTHTGEKPYLCSECGTSFTARYSLQIHMNIHLGKKPYVCSYCNKAFSDKSTMRKHVRVHTGEKPFRCQECKRCFGESGTLAAHLATHRSDRPFKCNKCELRFKTTGRLRQHEKVHSGEKQFACKFCGRKFLQKYNMTMHERIHTGEKPYTCYHCQRSFRSRSCLAKHVVLHGGDDERRFRCDHCSSQFYRKAHLRRHIDMHLGIKNYECNACLKKFCTRGTLKSHIKTFHSHGARRFPCNWCGRVFKRKIYVSTHVCVKNRIKSENGEQETSSRSPDFNPEEVVLNQDNSSDSEGSSVDVKSEPEDEVMEDGVDDDGDKDNDDNKEEDEKESVVGEESLLNWNNDHQALTVIDTSKY
ncbi:uncharacterized protein [Panulirus ornatus]|uniref:uncharacterized protein n=1 Tax=Panulirus ornatus TaxID=150431 RepID=UPI003A879FB2